MLTAAPGFAPASLRRTLPAGLLSRVGLLAEMAGDAGNMAARPGGSGAAPAAPNGGGSEVATLLNQAQVAQQLAGANGLSGGTASREPLQSFWQP
jgi:hypothetical protein